MLEKKPASNKIRFVTLGPDSSEEDLKKFLPQYFRIRNRAFPDGLYGNCPTTHDIDPDNIARTSNTGIRYVLATLNGKVVGGSNYVVSRPGSGIALHFNEHTALNGDKFRIKDMLSEELMEKVGMDPKKVSYGEVAGLAIDPDYQGIGIGKKLEKELFKHAAKDADFLLGAARSTNFITILKVSEETGVDAMVFEDQAMLSSPAGTLYIPMAFSKDSRLFDELRKDGIGVPKDEFIHEVKSLLQNNPELFAQSEEGFKVRQAEIARRLSEQSATRQR